MWLYLFYILVERAGAAAVTLLAKEKIPIRLLPVEKKADVTLESGLGRLSKISTTLSRVTGRVELNEMLRACQLALTTCRLSVQY